MDSGIRIDDVAPIKRTLNDELKGSMAMWQMQPKYSHWLKMCKVIEKI